MAFKAPEWTDRPVVAFFKINVKHFKALDRGAVGLVGVQGGLMPVESRSVINIMYSM